MGITLGEYAFGESVTSVRESLKERGGRDARVVLIKGVLEGFASVAALEAELDALVAAASDAEEVALVLRPGRRLWVKRTGFVREVYRDALTAAFELSLEAPDAVEEAEEESVVAGVYTDTQQTLSVPANGNTPARPRIALVPEGPLTRPSVGVGDSALTYDGVVAAGQSLVVDAAAGAVLLDGVDVTPYTAGVPPLLAPGSNILTYADESISIPNIAVTVRFHSRWW